MDFFNCRYYKINKFFLSCHGQWVYQTTRGKIMGRTFIFCSLISTIYLQIRFIMTVWGDLDAILECLPPMLLTIMCFCQLTIYTISNKKLLLLVNCIKNDWKLWSSSGLELEILRDYAESGRNFTLLYAGYVSSSVFTFISMSIMPSILNILIPLNETRPKQMVYPASFPFDHDKYFNWIIAHGSMTAFLHLTILFSCEAMFAVTARHACGLFAITSYRLKNILKITDSRNLSIEQSRKDCLYKEMISSIRYHNYAIRFSKDLESLYSPFFFFTIGGNTLNTSILLLQVLKSLGNLAITIKYGTFAMATIFHIFVISLPAQNLLDHSSVIANAVYSVSWYEMPEKSKKLLTMITMQAYRPCKLTASNACVIDMVTFSKIVKTSLSYFTVLSSFQ